MTGQNQNPTLADAAKTVFKHIPEEARANMVPSFAVQLYLPVTPEGAIQRIHQNLIKPNQQIARKHFPNNFEDPTTTEFARLVLQAEAMSTAGGGNGFMQALNSKFEEARYGLGQDDSYIPFLNVRQRLIKHLQKSKHPSDRINIPYLSVDLCLHSAWLLSRWDELETITRTVRAPGQGMNQVVYTPQTHDWYKKFFDLTGRILVGDSPGA